MALEFIWAIISPILGDAIKERIRPKASQDIAKEKAFTLYKTLGIVDHATDDFVNNFGYLISAINSMPITDTHITATGDATIAAIRFAYSAQDLIIALSKMNSDLKRLDPQLEIHFGNFVDLLSEIYTQSRQADRVIFRFPLSSFLIGQDLKCLNSFLYDSQELSPYTLPQQYILSKEELPLLLIQAVERKENIRNAIEVFREFLAKEFPFKESF
jgi:hypothetical protein